MPRGQGRVQPTPLDGPVAVGRPGPWVAPQATLRRGGVLFCIKNPNKFLGQSDDILCCDFSEIQKQQK